MNNVINWLLKDDTPEVKYRTMTELLGMSKDELEVKKAYENLLSSKRLNLVMDKFKSNKKWEDINAFLALAEFGLTRIDVPIDEYIERIIKNMNLSMKCAKILLLRNLVSLGYYEHPWVQEQIPLVFSTIRQDGDGNEFALPGGHVKIGETLENGLHRVKINRNGYENFNEAVYIDDSNRNITVMLESPYENSISGKITIADKDTNIANNLPLASAKITLTKKSGSISLTKSVYTDLKGMYSIVDIPAGEYELVVEKYGYISVIQAIVIERGQNQYYNLVIESISDEYRGLGFAGGSVVDAFTGIGVAGLTLEVYNGLFIIPGVGRPGGTLADTLVTGTNGIYNTSALNAGNYTVVVTDNREGIEEIDRYYKSMFVIKILGNTNILSQNGIVSRGLENNQVRIVLTWGSTPSDLDSHLSITTENGSIGHVYYGNKSYFVGSVEVANLDLDDVTSYGPETTTIFTEIDGVFIFRIHDYTNRYNSSSQALANSGATVSIYIGYLTVPIRIFYVPSGAGTKWIVFSYDSNTGTITPINTMS